MSVTASPPVPPESSEAPSRRLRLGSLMRAAEIDMRLLGMVGALALIWVGFHFWSGGTFLTPEISGTCRCRRPRWRSWPRAWCSSWCPGTSTCRSVPCSGRWAWPWPCCSGRSSRLDRLRPLGDVDHRPRSALLLGALIGGLHGFIIAYVGVPSFIVTLGGYLVWRGVAWWQAQFIVQASGRCRPHASAKPATMPDGSVAGRVETRYAVPEVPRLTTGSRARDPARAPPRRCRPCRVRRACRGQPKLPCGGIRHPPRRIGRPENLRQRLSTQPDVVENARVVFPETLDHHPVPDASLRSVTASPVSRPVM